jgi:hypothetical protein
MVVDEVEIRKQPVPGGVRPVLPSEEIPVEIISRPITKDEVWGLAEEQEKAKLDAYKQTQAELREEERDLEARIQSKTEPTFKVSEILSEGCAVSPK